MRHNFCTQIVPTAGLSQRFCNFMDQLLYFIKYKDTSVNTLELMITAFQAGLASKEQ